MASPDVHYYFVIERISEGMMEALVSLIVGCCNKFLKVVLFEVFFLVDCNKCGCAKSDYFCVLLGLSDCESLRVVWR